jgi:hypothetical protein
LVVKAPARLDTPPRVDILNLRLSKEPDEAPWNGFYSARKGREMNQNALEERLIRLEKELRLGGEQAENRFLELRVEIDRMKLDLAAVKTFLGSAFPSFSEQFPQILERTVQEIDPEST